MIKPLNNLNSILAFIGILVSMNSCMDSQKSKFKTHQIDHSNMLEFKFDSTTHVLDKISFDLARITSNDTINTGGLNLKQEYPSPF